MVWYCHLFKSFPQFIVVLTKALAQSMKQMFFWNSLVISMNSLAFSRIPLLFLGVYGVLETFSMFCFHLFCFVLIFGKP